MNDFSNSIVVVYPASWPTDVVEPHSTILYLGEIPNVDFTKEDVQGALDSLDFQGIIMATPTGFEMFGEENDIKVLKISSPLLVPIHSVVAGILSEVGAKSASDFDYSPHITIGEDTDYPERIALSAPVLWWGLER